MLVVFGWWSRNIREGGNEVGVVTLLLIPGEGVVETNNVGWVDVCCMKGG